MLTNEQIRELFFAIKEHRDAEAIIALLEETILGELELSGVKLLDAMIDNDPDAVIHAFTGWDTEDLLKKARIIRDDTSVFYPQKEQTPDNVIFWDLPWEKNAETAPEAPAPATPAQFDPENYTAEYCPFCENEVVIYATGITACPECGKPLALCSMCEECVPNCPYGCTGGKDDEFKKITNPAISQKEIDLYWKEG